MSPRLLIGALLVAHDRARYFAGIYEDEGQRLGWADPRAVHLLQKRERYRALEPKLIDAIVRRQEGRYEQVPVQTAAKAANASIPPGVGPLE